MDKYYKDGFHERDQNWANASFACAHRVKFDLFRRFGLIAAAGDRHLAEFMPGDEYLRDPETVRAWKFGLTSVRWRKDDLKVRLEKSRAMVSGEREVDMAPSGEEGVLLMKALCGLGRVVSNVNLPNAGQIPNLPLGAVVETNAVFSRDSVRPVLAGPLPEGVRRLIAPHVENHALTLRAALECDRGLVVQALRNDPNTAAKCGDEGELGRLADDMIAATSKYLPVGWGA